MVRIDTEDPFPTESSTHDKLIWCADMKHLPTIWQAVFATDFYPKEQKKILSSRGAESVYTLFLGVDVPPEYFGTICEGHFFYTPSRQGLGNVHRSELAALLADWQHLSRDAFYVWLESFCRLNTYEISLPVLNDQAPRRKEKAD